MRIRDLFSLSSRALLINKGRSTLTMLGIVIGIASVILIMSVGQAAQAYLLSQVASFGSDLVFIANGRGDETRGGPPSATPKQTLSVTDFEKIQAATWVRASSASVIAYDLVSFGSEEKRTAVAGSSPDEPVIFNVTMQEGRYVDEDDVQSHGRVVVLGRDVARKLFGEQDAIGRTMKVGKQSFRVIGVTAPAGTRFFSNADDQVYIPYTTFLDLYNKKYLNFISVKTGDVRPAEAKERLRDILRETHRIDNPSGDLAKDDFRVASQEDAIRNADTIGTVLQVLLASIASISLFVAGIGIMNIMYVTVTERTREIGLRKAIGATRTNIMGQFLLEAVMLTLVAGLFGVIAGIGFSWLAIQVILSFQSGWTFVLPWNGVGIAFAVSAAVGLIFGYYPARKAARLNPIEALRYE